MAAVRRNPVTAAIVALTIVALALRIYQLTRPDYLLGVTEYDDGTDFGSALQLVNGHLPYRDFVIVQPPGITLLMAPVALLAKGVGTAWAMGIGRILTALAGAAAVTLGGLLVRQRGMLAVVLTCGILAIYPSAVQAAHTVLLEPWLVLFCLAGALAVFDRDRITTSLPRLVGGGLLFGFAGAIKVWAVLPVLVILALSARRPRRALAYLAGVVAGFVVPVLPFAALAPRTFYNSVVIAQLVRKDAVRIPLSYRLHQMTGLTDFTTAGPLVLVIFSLALVAAVVGCALVATRLTRHGPPELEWFGLVTATLVVISFLWPADFYYHYPGFLAPFLALAVALPSARLVDALRPAASRRVLARWLARYSVAAASIVIIGLGITQAVFESSLQPPLAPTTPGLDTSVVTAASNLIPPGSCVLTDQVSFTIAANRFYSNVPGCSLMVDGVGTDYSLAHGLNAVTGAQKNPAVRAVWMSALEHAQYVWLSNISYKRIPWTSGEITGYFDRNFVPVLGGPFGLYVHKGLQPR
ncbi:MAG TPA: glycosyltransferase 87 family protein [Streptosporangiaceae bacterium]|nr:glycosyltransferase 87 family protein [Streptosporangiaceae bacterium]